MDQVLHFEGLKTLSWCGWWFQCLWQASDIPDPFPFLQIALYLLLAVVCNAQFVSNAESSKGWSTVILSANKHHGIHSHLQRDRDIAPRCSFFVLAPEQLLQPKMLKRALFEPSVGAGCCSFCWRFARLSEEDRAKRLAELEEREQILAQQQEEQLRSKQSQASTTWCECSNSQFAWCCMNLPVLLVLFSDFHYFTFRSVPLPHSGANLTFDLWRKKPSAFRRIALEILWRQKQQEWQREQLQAGKLPVMQHRSSESFSNASQPCRVLLNMLLSP